MSTLVTLAYLVAASLFIIGLKRLGSPATARVGNQMAGVGMLIAIVVTLFVFEIINPVVMVAGIGVGAGIGFLMAQRVAMTAMPEMVAAFNGFGGLASALVAAGEIAKYRPADPSIKFTLFDPFAQFEGGAETLGMGLMVTVLLSVMIGSVTFSGSFVAYGKLSGFVTGRPVNFPGMRLLSVVVLLGVLGAGTLALLATPGFFTAPAPVVYGLAVVGILSLALGILLVIPIGGADMPVVIALLNSYSGIAAAATGFVLGSAPGAGSEAAYVLIVSGALVGASGIILTKIMCDAMNRSLANVLLGGFGGGEAVAAAGPAAALDGRIVRETSAEDAAILLAYGSKVIIVPGYGMAVAQAQHAVRELSDLLQARGVTVKYAIHPVAGRMPGHMNVLLAEANVPYDQLFEMEEINPDFETTDVALIVGANDVVNPAARHDAASPIYGMPILNVDRAQHIIFLKRSLRPGYAGVENELFTNGKTAMLFGDAKDSLVNLVGEVKGLD